MAFNEFQYLELYQTKFQYWNPKVFWGRLQQVEGFVQANPKHLFKNNHSFSQLNQFFNNRRVAEQKNMPSPGFKRIDQIFMRTL